MKPIQVPYEVMWQLILDEGDLEDLEETKAALIEMGEMNWVMLFQNQIDEIQKGIQWLERNPQLTQNLSE